MSQWQLHISYVKASCLHEHAAHRNGDYVQGATAGSSSTATAAVQQLQATLLYQLQPAGNVLCLVVKDMTLCTTSIIVMAPTGRPSS